MLARQDDGPATVQKLIKAGILLGIQCNMIYTIVTWSLGT